MQVEFKESPSQDAMSNSVSSLHTRQKYGIAQKIQKKKRPFFLQDREDNIVTVFCKQFVSRELRFALYLKWVKSNPLSLD